jgi:hypothetical protein
VIPSSKLMTVLSAKLLKPLISKLFNLTFSRLFGKWANVTELPRKIVPHPAGLSGIIHVLYTKTLPASNAVGARLSGRITYTQFVEKLSLASLEFHAKKHPALLGRDAVVRHRNGATTG